MARALFCVRLLEQGSESSPEQRLSFLSGAFLASDLDAMISGGWLSAESKVVITGGGALAEAWRSVLAESSIQAIPLSDSEVEGALLAGCRSVVATFSLAAPPEVG